MTEDCTKGGCQAAKYEERLLVLRTVNETQSGTVRVLGTGNEELTKQLASVREELAEAERQSERDNARISELQRQVFSQESELSNSRREIEYWQRRLACAVATFQYGAPVRDHRKSVDLKLKLARTRGHDIAGALYHDHGLFLEALGLIEGLETEVNELRGKLKKFDDLLAAVKGDFVSLANARDHVTRIGNHMNKLLFPPRLEKPNVEANSD